jgi:hypothetical protein
MILKGPINLGIISKLHLLLVSLLDRPKVITLSGFYSNGKKVFVMDWFQAIEKHIFIFIFLIFYNQFIIIFIIYIYIFHYRTFETTERIYGD